MHVFNVIAVLSKILSSERTKFLHGKPKPMTAVSANLTIYARILTRKHYFENLVGSLTFPRYGQRWTLGWNSNLGGKRPQGVFPQKKPSCTERANFYLAKLFFQNNFSTVKRGTSRGNSRRVQQPQLHESRKARISTPVPDSLQRYLFLKHHLLFSSRKQSTQIANLICALDSNVYGRSRRVTKTGNTLILLPRFIVETFSCIAFSNKRLYSTVI